MTYEPDDPDWSAAFALGSYAWTLYNEFCDHWELQNIPDTPSFSESDRALFHRLDDFRGTVVEAVRTLRPSTELVRQVKLVASELQVDRDITGDVAAEFTRVMQAHPVVRDGLKIDLAIHATDTLLPGVEDRLLHLVPLLAARQLSERAAAFLSHATQLYMWGFGVETVVMCASALEAAYETRFPAEEMISLQVRKKHEQYEPWEYENASVAGGVYSQSDRIAAGRIRRGRNDALHNVPDSTLNPLEALSETARLLALLFPNLPAA